MVLGSVIAGMTLVLVAAILAAITHASGRQMKRAGDSHCRLASSRASTSSSDSGPIVTTITLTDSCSSSSGSCSGGGGGDGG